MTTNENTPTSKKIFGFTVEEFEAIERAEISDERAEELASYFCDHRPTTQEDEDSETWNKYVEECGGL
jgi:hypothetical protein